MIDAIGALVRRGPRADVGALSWLLGMWLWWRTWAVCALAGASFVVAVGVVDDVVGAWLCGLLGWMLVDAVAPERS